MSYGVRSQLGETFHFSMCTHVIRYTEYYIKPFNEYLSRTAGAAPELAILDITRDGGGAVALVSAVEGTLNHAVVYLGAYIGRI